MSEPAVYESSTVKTPALGREDHSVFWFASSLSVALRVPRLVVLVEPTLTAHS
jgi:hypothetical protein